VRPTLQNPKTKTQHRKETAITTKAKDPKTATPTTEPTRLQVVSVEGSDEAKGKFVRFVANSKNIQCQVWLRNATLAKFSIAPKSILEIDPSTIAIASWYDPSTKTLKLDADGNEQASPVVYEYTTEGVTYKYPYGRLTLDMGLKVTACDNSEVRKVVAFNPL
jgi:hypothetical protein